MQDVLWFGFRKSFVSKQPRKSKHHPPIRIEMVLIGQCYNVTAFLLTKDLTTVLSAVSSTTYLIDSRPT